MARRLPRARRPRCCATSESSLCIWAGGTVRGRPLPVAHTWREDCRGRADRGAARRASRLCVSGPAARCGRCEFPRGGALMLKVTDLEAGYGGSQVLHALSLHVGDGETVVVLGPNGHGKSTLLRAISGLIRPSAGRVEFDGVDLTRLPTEQIVGSGVVHIPQGDLPFPEMTVLENLLVGAYRPGAWSERAERLEKVFHLFSALAEGERQLARSLSGGERRMLAL